MYKLVLVVLLTITSFSAGKAEDKESIRRQSAAKTAFAMCLPSLKSNIQGIVESTIYNVVLVKKYYPSADYTSIVERLNEIADENMDPTIRFKAHLASIYLSFSEMIDVQPKFHTFEREYIFRQITEQLENKLLASRN
jgi:hypothetical protein